MLFYTDRQVVSDVSTGIRGGENLRDVFTKLSDEVQRSSGLRARGWKLISRVCELRSREMVSGEQSEIWSKRLENESR